VVVPRSSGGAPTLLSPHDPQRIPEKVKAFVANFFRSEEINMARVKRGTKRRARRKKILRRAKGYFLTKSKLYQAAKEQVEKGLRYAYRDRRNRKREFRALWIQRIGAGARNNGISYSQFMNGLKKAGVTLDRKVLADIAVRDAEGFATLASQAKAALA